MRRVLALVTTAFALSPAAAHAANVSWHACPPGVFHARCGHVAVPFDRLDPTAGSLHVGFVLYLRRDTAQPPIGTLAAIEGGPGFATTGSASSYLTLDAPLMDRRDLLLVDDRGTGTSGALSCPAFDRWITDYQERAGRCAAQLGPAVNRYDTHSVADDLAGVLDALGIARIDLYGDSYGSYAAQAFAVLHPTRLRSLVLDGTYPLPGTDPAYGDLAQATQRALRLVCDRRPGCAARGVDPVAELTAFVQQLRQHPSVGIGRDANGQRLRVHVNEAALVTVLQDAYGDFAVYRDILAAVRSYQAGDRVPLLRLIAENATGRRSGSTHEWSEALYLAVSCHDYPQLWDTAAPIPVRQQELAAARAALPPDEFAPFSPTAWTSLAYEGATACLRWPGPDRPDPPVPPDAPYPSVPTLVLNGDLDNITASSGARVVASRFPDSTFVETHNMIHISALGDRDDCAAPIVRRFVDTLAAGDTSCAQRIEEVRVVDAFPVMASDAEAARPGAGDASTTLDRQVAAVAAATLADAVQRWAINFSGHSRGLRGGRWSYTGGDVVRFRFDRTRFASDVAVSGQAQWSTLDGPISAHLRVAGPGGLRERLTLGWNMQAQLATATIDGVAGRRPLHATMLAP
jgi:pimeloyl-ACP methyl ester carboxylesterase